MRIKRLYYKLRLKLRRKKTTPTLTLSKQYREEQARIAEAKSYKFLEEVLHPKLYNIQIQLGKDKEGKERMYYYYDVEHYTLKNKSIMMELKGETVASRYDIVKITEVIQPKKPKKS